MRLDPIDWKIRARASLPKLPFPRPPITPPGIRPIQSPILVRLTAQPVYRLGHPVLIQFDVQNVSNEVYQLLTWNTPLEGELLGDCFTVIHGGQIVPYDGRLVSRADPGLNEYVTIQPGQVLTATAALSSVYAIEELGEYDVIFSGLFFDGFAVPSGAILEPHPRSDFSFLTPISGTAQFNTVQFQPPQLTEGQRHRIAMVEKWHGLRPRVTTAGGAGGGVTPELNGFNTEQTAEVLLAHETALHYARDARIQLTKKPAGIIGLYEDWFGAFEEARYECVKSHYGDIADTLSSEQVTYEFDAGTSYVAWTIPEIAGLDWHKVWVGPKFFNFAHFGLDNSMFGVIVHEWTHAFCSTGDPAYGVTQDTVLKDNDPGKAADCADNHEIFVDALAESEFGKGLSIHLDRDQIAMDEIQRMLSQGLPAIPDLGFRVEVYGCWPNLLGISPSDLGTMPGVHPTLSVTPSVPGMAVTFTHLDAEDSRLPEKPLKFTWYCQLAFTNAEGFPTGPGQVYNVSINASTTAGSHPLSDRADIRLLGGSTPPPDLADLYIAPSNATAPEDVLGTIRLTGPSPIDVAVDLASDNNVAAVPPLVIVCAWNDSASFTIHTLDLNPQVASTRTAWITASLRGVNKRKRLIVTSYGEHPDF